MKICDPFWKPVIGLFVAGLLVINNSFESVAQGPNFVDGNLFNLTNSSSAPNGVWSWFEDERAIIDNSDANNPRLILSSVSAGSGSESGDVDLLWRNLGTGAQGHFELHNQLQQDDHNSAALYRRPDGRYVAMYSKHIGDDFTRWRVSTNPNDPTSWGSEQVLNNGAGTTYNNVYHLPNDNGGAGRTYNFTRTTNFDPNIQISNDDGSNWTAVGKLLTEGGGGDRPYVRYAASDDKIFLMTSNRHPRDFPNSIFSGYVQDGQLHQMNGTVVDNNLFDGSAVAPTALTSVFNNGSTFGGTTMNRAWTINVEVDNTNNPVGIFSARANDSEFDHRFFYSRFDGQQWQVNELARAGGFLYSSERDYTGLVSIDPSNPNVVYMSSDIDPRSDTETDKYELYKGLTSDFGQSWDWSAITSNSTIDNLRPVVPEWDGKNTAVTWLRGNYYTYTNWDTDVVGINFTSTDPKSLLWQGNSATSTQWDVSTSQNWDSGGGAIDRYLQGAEVAFDDSAASTNVHIQSTVTPMGVAFNNESTHYTLTGQGISGSGGIRVIGGGNVTLSNAENTYTGRTMIAKGTLALAGNAQLSGTQQIAISASATLDTSALSAGALQLNGQTLINKGKVQGNLSANAGSTVELRSTGSVNGNVHSATSTVIASGQIQGDLRGTSGSVIRVGSDGIDVTRSLVYVEATHGTNGNTMESDGGTFNPTGNPDWEIRTGLGNGGIVYQGGSENPNSAEELATTISGLTPGNRYQTYVNYWDATGSDWRILAGAESENLTLFGSPRQNVNGATDGLDPSTLGDGGPSLISEANRRLWAGDIGELVANENGEIVVFIDDTGTNDGDDRTWYDGISYLSDPTGFAGQTTLAIGGDFELDSTSTLRLDIADATAYDRVTIAGTADFAGTLEVALAAGASALQLGDSFDLFDFGGANGTFDALLLPTLDDGLGWDASGLYSSGTISVSAIAIPEPSSIACLGTALASWFMRRRRR